MRRAENRTAATIAVGFVVLLLTFCLLWRVQAKRGGAATDFDAAVLRFFHLHRSLAGDALTWAAAFLGSLWVVFGVAGSAILAAARVRHAHAASETDAVFRHAGRIMPIACGGGILLVEAAKWAFRRPRPHAFVPLFRATGYSFPSGHAFLGLVVFGLLGYFALAEARRRGVSRSKEVVIMLGAGLLALGIGVSRVYAGVHYPTDVLAGWAGGAAWLLLCLRLFRAQIRPV